MRWDFLPSKVFCNELGGIREQKLKNLSAFIVGRTEGCPAPSAHLGSTKSKAENCEALKQDVKDKD